VTVLSRGCPLIASESLDECGVLLLELLSVGVYKTWLPLVFRPLGPELRNARLCCRLLQFGGSCVQTHLRVDGFQQLLNLRLIWLWSILVSFALKTFGLLPLRSSVLFFQRNSRKLEMRLLYLSCNFFFAGRTGPSLRI
jgi:hypothetical protein